ncbi:MAG: hypothetical protein NVSMB44_35130 [Ktedonobacteraceae bacterium]
MRRISGVLFIITGILACPCHLVITLPLLIALLAGTAAGSFFIHNSALVYLGATIYFVVGLVVGLWLISRQRERAINVDSPTCSPTRTRTHL